MFQIALLGLLIAAMYFLFPLEGFATSSGTVLQLEANHSGNASQWDPRRPDLRRSN